MVKKHKWQVEVLTRGKIAPGLKQYVKKISLQVLKNSEEYCRHKITPESLSVLLTNDEEIKKLNHQYRKKNKATDVLSFSQIEGNKNAEFSASLGDLVISLETASKQAKEYKVTLKAELKRLVVHGILHLFGYDHEKVSAREARLMRQLEQSIFSSL